MVQGLPLLHVGETISHATTVDLRLVALASVLLGLLLQAIWAPALSSAVHSLRTRRIQRALAVRFAAALTALAILPAVLPYDHLLPEHHGHAAASAVVADERVHASHCHATPASCADAPIAAGPGQFLTSEPLIIVPVTVAVLLIAAVLPWRSVTRRPGLRPPVAVAVA
jgi:hypothetical protein